MCNAHNRSPDCTCGFGGEDSLGGGNWPQRDYTYISPQRPSHNVVSLTSYRYKNDDFCRPTTCKCGVEVFFIRHNGGSVWVEELGWPWQKHECDYIESFNKTYQIINDLGLRYAKESTKPVLGRIVKRIYRSFDLVYLIAKEDGSLVAVSASRYGKTVFTNLVAIRTKGDRIYLEDSRDSVCVTNCELATKVVADYQNSPEDVLHVGFQPPAFETKRPQKVNKQRHKKQKRRGR